MSINIFGGMSAALGAALDLAHQGAAPSIVSAAIRLDAANEQGAMCGRVAWASRTGSKNITAIHWVESSAVAGTFTCRIGLQDMSAAAQGVPDGTFDQFVDVTSSTNGRNTATLGSARTVAFHDELAVVWKMTAYTSGRVQPSGLSARGATDVPRFSGFCRVDTAGDWSVPSTVAQLANVVFEFDDGSFGWMEGGTPCITAINVEAYNSGTAGAGLGTGDERALRFTVNQPLSIDGIRGWLATAGATSDFDAVLYNGTASLMSISYDATKSWTPTQAMRDTFFFGDIALATGNTYYAAIKPTTANNVTIYTATFADANHAKLMYGGLLTVGYDCRADAGAWQNNAGSDTRVPLFSLSVTGVDAGGSGGGLIVNPGMGGRLT